MPQERETLVLELPYHWLHVILNQRWSDIYDRNERARCMSVHEEWESAGYKIIGAGVSRRTDHYGLYDPGAVVARGDIMEFVLEKVA